MIRLPQVVLDRLRGRVPPATEHPSSDLLAAFAERSLADPERRRVMVHLSGCQQCRAELYLAQEAAQAGQLAAPSGARTVDSRRGSASSRWSIYGWCALGVS